MYSKWIESFLDSRKQKVIANGVASNPKDVTSGVPQGSVIGQILFVLYINALPDIIKNGSIPYLFADDTKIFHSIRCKQDCKGMQVNSALGQVDQSRVVLGQLSPVILAWSYIAYYFELMMPLLF